MRIVRSVREEWEAAQVDLGIEVVAPVKIKFSSGKELVANVLVKRFGAPNGMSLVTDPSSICGLEDELVQAGYGFSVISELKVPRLYDRETIIALLTDWGWAGTPAESPLWLNVSDPIY